jgi:hypothetical protein
MKMEGKNLKKVNWNDYQLWSIGMRTVEMIHCAVTK